MNENIKPSNVLFAHLRNLQNVRGHPSSMIPEKLTLDNVAAYNVYLDVGDTKTSSIVTLREVPRFLIEAFSRFGELDGCNTEGIFRKEGNAARMKGFLPIFFGSDKIPPNLQVHDVCSWIKKFFRELRAPLFVNREMKLVKFAEDLQDPIALVATMMSILDSLPTPHIGALGYLMRCLKEISDHADQHHMTIDNLATVFAPSLFRGLPESDTKPLKSSKKKRGSQEDLLKDMKKNNDLQVLVIKLLIQNANLIGAPKDCYKASRRPSDLKKKSRGIIASSIQKKEEVNGSPTSYQKSANYLNKHSRSSTNLVNIGSAGAIINKQQQQSDDDSEKSRKAKQRRSNSVVRVLGVLKNQFKKILNELGYR